MALNQELDGRKTKILQTIIKTYLETGEPVGSRTISKYTDLNLSSATIRNEMADLEDLGYIIQPHTSAGRIPSDKGYRWYVDQLMEYIHANYDNTELDNAVIATHFNYFANKTLFANTNNVEHISVSHTLGNNKGA